MLLTSEDRTIFHCDCDAFFASVEETFHPEYKLRPMAVAGDPENRHGIILAKNALAKRSGVKTAETIWSARQKCPELLLTPPRHGVYGEFCGRVNEIYGHYTDRVEPLSIDESFLELTGCLHLFGGDAARVAHEIRLRVQREIGITISIGVSWNKMFAKLGSDLNKPNNICVISRENYRDVVWPQPVGEFFGIGKKAAEQLRRWGICTIGDLAAADDGSLERSLGSGWRHMLRCANGLDDSAVHATGDGGPAKSVGNGMTFRRDLASERDIRTGVLALADTVASRLRQSGVKCRTVQVTIKDTALKSITRQKTVPPTFLAADLARAAMELILAAWPVGPPQKACGLSGEPGCKPIRLLTVTAQNLITPEDEEQQLTLFQTANYDPQKAEQLEQAMDRIREKYGRRSIRPGAVVQNDLGI